jgi:hypothetical protein
VVGFDIRPAARLLWGGAVCNVGAESRIQELGMSITLRIVAVVLGLFTLASCASTSGDNTTYVRDASPPAGGFQIPIN